MLLLLLLVSSIYFRSHHSNQKAGTPAKEFQAAKLFTDRNSTPIMCSEPLAMRLQQNWLAHPRVEQLASIKESLDDSLTSLNWLQNLNVSYMTGGASSPTVSLVAPNTNDAMKIDPNQVLANHHGTQPHLLNNCRLHGMELGNPHLPFERIDYRSNPYVKPPYSYATLICMAMKESKKAKITLQSIYNWITENYMYYRITEPSWQVRTNS